MRHGIAGVCAIDESLLLSVLGVSPRGERAALGQDRLADHSQCVAVSELFRGKLCEELGRRRARQLDSGEFLYHMGEAARSVYLVRGSLIKTSMVSPGGHELTLRIHKAGDILGELCLCVDERREQAVALEESEVVEIPLTRTLLDLASDLGEPTPHGTQIGHHITQEELARLISARREVVSSLLNELRKTGLISYTRRGFIVVNRQTLQSLLESISQA